MSKHPSHRTRQIIKSFEAKALKKRSPTAKFADKLTAFFGSFWFLALNLFLFLFWILANQGMIKGVPIFDPFPYVLLITIVSLEAIILTVVVLMSQNRQSQISTLRDELQLQVELITEKELSKALHLLRKILEKHNIKYSDDELEEMLETVDTSYIERKLEEQLNPKTKNMPKKVVEKVEKTISK
ncbi:DUF1003 domain-containing protein [Patescibacteria group bacterium]